MLKKLASNVWFWIGIVVAVLLAILGHEQSKNKVLGLQLFQALFNNKNQKLEDNVKKTESDINTEKKIQQQLQQNREESKNKSQSPSDEEKFWNKN